MALEDRFIFFPDRSLQSTPADAGLAFEDVWLTAEDGVRTHGWLVPGKRPATLLWLHGNAGNISHRLDNLVLMHSRLGVSIFILDYRGYGLSEGRPSERGMYMDALAALRHLREGSVGRPESLILIGRSLGGAVAVHLAANERVDGVILESTFASVASMARRTHPYLPVWPLLRNRFNSIGKIKRCSMPLLFVHSLDDETVPYAEGLKLFEAAPEPKRLHTIETGGHNETYLQGGDAYWRALDGFISEAGKPPAG